MKAGSLIFLFVSNRIKLPLSPTTISTTHANEVRRRNRPNLPVRNLDFCCSSSPPQQQVDLTGGKVAQVSFSFLIRSVSRECVQQNQPPLSILFSTSLFCCCVQLKDDRDCEQFSPNYRAAGPVTTWKGIREKQFCASQIVSTAETKLQHNTSFREYTSVGVTVQLHQKYRSIRSQDKTDGQVNLSCAYWSRGLKRGKD